MGTGWVATARHIPSYRRHPEAEVVAVYDRRPGAGRADGHRRGRPPVVRRSRRVPRPGPRRRQHLHPPDEPRRAGHRRPWPGHARPHRETDGHGRGRGPGHGRRRHRQRPPAVRVPQLPVLPGRDQGRALPRRRDSQLRTRRHLRRRAPAQQPAPAPAHLVPGASRRPAPRRVPPPALHPGPLPRPPRARPRPGHLGPRHRPARHRRDPAAGTGRPRPGDDGVRHAGVGVARGPRRARPGGRPRPVPRHRHVRPQRSGPQGGRRPAFVTGRVSPATWPASPRRGSGTRPDASSGATTS